jgi:hypothetical protein
MRGQTLDKTDEEREIGLTISMTLKPSIQCAKAVKSAGTVLAKLAGVFTSEMDMFSKGSIPGM